MSDQQNPPKTLGHIMFDSFAELSKDLGGPVWPAWGPSIPGLCDMFDKTAAVVVDAARTMGTLPDDDISLYI